MFATHADLMAWAKERASGCFDGESQLAALEDIRSVAIRHSHLLGARP